MGAPASGAASGMAGSSPAGGPGHGGASLPPPSVYNETVGETVQGQSEREWDGGWRWESHAAPAPAAPGMELLSSGPAPPMGTTAGRAGGHGLASHMLWELPL